MCDGRLLVLCSVVLLCVVSGCRTTPTYINIPHQSGDVAWSDPNTGTVIQLMSTSLSAVLEREPIKGAFDVLLPEGSTTQTYQQVVMNVGGGAVTPETVREGELLAVQVIGVRVRSDMAEVDVVRPSASGREAATVMLKWYWSQNGGEWGVQRVRPWRISAAELIELERGARAAVPKPTTPRGNTPTGAVSE